MIKFVYEPRVTLMAQPTFTQPAHLPVEFLGEATDGERLAEYAGRICYMSQKNPAGRTTEQYIDNVLGQGHGSIFEHTTIVLLLEGISRSCTHELVRHRAGFGYSQLSQRYVDETDCEFVIPPAILESKEHVLEGFKTFCEGAKNAYGVFSEELFKQYEHIEDRVLRRKTAREAARSVLPNATETKIVVSANIRAWRTMLELRCGPGAEREIRRLALVILATLQVVAPHCFSDFEVVDLPDGTKAAFPTYHKV